ncbi:ATP synthase subunit I [Thioclava sp. 15-R06ZXC-3]|uniref:ATP synthase subunit I n=1 Tax=Thioclava arctica TaxID=3238301 RepID=A0ABV3TGN3_9RHOB
MNELSALPMPILLSLSFLAGLALGYGYFRALRVTADMIVRGASAWLALALTVGRLALLGAGFYLAVLAGGLALLAALGGVLVAKTLMVRQARRAAP